MYDFLRNKFIIRVFRIRNKRPLKCAKIEQSFFGGYTMSTQKKRKFETIAGNCHSENGDSAQTEGLHLQGAGRAFRGQPAEALSLEAKSFFRGMD